MPIPNCELEGTSVVLVGNFNPAIFHPSWLASHNMVRGGEAEKAQIQIVSPEVSSFTTEWLSLQVTRERFQASTSDARFFDPLRDLVVSIFTLLEHTPVRQVGINRDMHFACSRELMNQFGDLLAPKAIWNKVLDTPLLEALMMIGKRQRSEAKAFRVIIQPSIRVTPGIYIGANEHFEAEDEQSPQKILGFLKASWEDSQRAGRQMAEQLLSELTD
jgi:hypothetical protein